jgi:hypothetical protein
MTKGKSSGASSARRRETVLSATETSVLYWIWLKSGPGWARGALVTDLVRAFDPGRPAQSRLSVRKYIQSLRKRKPPYVEAYYLPKKDHPEGRQPAKNATAVRYRFIADTFVYWPRTAAFVLQLLVMPSDESRTVSRVAFKKVLKERLGFSDEDFKSDFDYTALRPSASAMRPKPNYVVWHCPDDRIRPTERVYKELQFLKMVARRHKEIARDRPHPEIVRLLTAVEKLESS